MIRYLLVFLLLAAPGVLPAQNVRFAVVTDTHVGKPGAASNLRAAVRGMKADKGLNFVLLTGDIAHDGRAAGHRRARRILRRLPQPLYVTTGNHDAKEPRRLASFRRRFGSGVFRFEVRGIRFAGISTGPYEPGRHAMLTPRMTAQLAEACRDTLPVVVAAHHTPDLIARPDRAFEGVDTSRIVLWIAGHVHRFGTAETLPAPSLTCPSTLDAGRYTVVEIDGGQLRVTVRSPRDGGCEACYATKLNL